MRQKTDEKDEDGGKAGKDEDSDNESGSDDEDGAGKKKKKAGESKASPSKVCAEVVYPGDLNC